MRILHLIDSLAYHNSARQLQMLAPALAADRGSVEICCLGADTPWAASLRQAGLTVHTLGWTRWLDFGALWNLREIVRQTSVDLIHVWRMPALRTLAVMAKDMLPRVVMSDPLPGKGDLGWWDRRLLQQVRCLAVAGLSDQECCLRQGLVQPVLRVVPPAVATTFPEKNPDTEAPRSIVCVTSLEREAGLREAIWAFDFVLILYPDARLQIIGAGSQLSALKALSQGLQNTAHVQFLNARADVSSELRAAAVVWIPSLGNTGRQLALEAMAQGRAVIASDVPCLRDVVRDGETGYLVPPGDVVPLVRQTRLLFADDRLRERLGETARQYVQQQYPLDDVVARWRDVYRGAAA
jgi:glycosyltransferase involved in cell wall biosynthesis